MLIVAIGYSDSFTCSSSPTDNEVDPSDLDSVMGHVCTYTGVGKESVEELLVFQNDQLVNSWSPEDL